MPDTHPGAAQRVRVALLFGGRSSEHSISCATAGSVLRHLDSELTGPEIARELFVTLNTLRTHTKRIFTKLDVTTRAAAVRRAHERGLL